MGLSSRRLLLIDSHRMVLTRERKNPSRIAPEISQILLGQSPRCPQSITRGAKFSAAQSVDRHDQLTFIKHMI